MRPELTHYIDAGTMEYSAAYNPNGRPSVYLRAACNATVRTAESSQTPTCPACRAWLKRAARHEAAMWARLGYVEIRPGVMGPKPEGSK
jgi:hypothetical protein